LPDDDDMHASNVIARASSRRADPTPQRKDFAKVKNSSTTRASCSALCGEVCGELFVVVDAEQEHEQLGLLAPR
jgi:hypothetical protein